MHCRLLSGSLRLGTEGLAKIELRSCIDMIDGSQAELMHDRHSHGASIPESRSLAVPAVPSHHRPVGVAGHGAASVPSFVSRIRSGISRVVCLIAVTVLLLLSVNHVSCSYGLTFARLGTLHPRRVQDSTPSLLRVFQVYPPVLTISPVGQLELSDGLDNASFSIGKPREPSCVGAIAEYSFANSYGRPFVGAYVPPQCSFNRVTWNLTVVSAGRQFDRLGTLTRSCRQFCACPSSKDAVTLKDLAMSTDSTQALYT